MSRQLHLQSFFKRKNEIGGNEISNSKKVNKDVKTVLDSLICKVVDEEKKEKKKSET